MLVKFLNGNLREMNAHDFIVGLNERLNVQSKSTRSVLQPTVLIKKAIQFVFPLYTGKWRKRTNPVPFVLHPLRTAEILSEFTQDESLIVAALLSQVIRKKLAKPEDLLEIFGKKITAIVMELSFECIPFEDSMREESKADYWRQRKEKQIQILKGLSPEAKIIAWALKVENLYDMIEGVKTEGHAYWQNNNFHGTPNDQITHYNSLRNMLVTAFSENPTEVSIGLESMFDKLLTEACTSFFNQGGPAPENGSTKQRKSISATA